MAAMKQHRQLTLPVQLPETAQFDTFVNGDNDRLVSYFQALTPISNQFQQVGIVGASGSGKSHLLFAYMERMQKHSLPTMYIDFKEMLEHLSPSVLDGLEQYDVLILDGIDRVVGRQDWCVSLFALINRFIDKCSGILVWSASRDPSSQNIVLADLMSRLEAATRFRVQKLSDERKVCALQVHAKARGLKLPEEVAEFLLQRLNRDMRTLMKVLKELDRLSIREQRRLTLPFVRNALKEVTL